MSNGKIAAAILAVTLIVVSTGFAQTLEENWNDFLHYTKIGRFDLATGYAQTILDSEPDAEKLAVRLLDLSKANAQGYQILLRVNEAAPDVQLTQLSGQILDLIEKGNYTRRADPSVIVVEIKRLSSTERGWFTAVKRLRNSGEYAIPFMLNAMVDNSRQAEFPNIVRALPKIGRDAIRPLAAALQTDNVALKAEIIKALANIGYPQSAPYLKYIVENDNSSQIRELAKMGLSRIDPGTLKLSAAQLFFSLAEKYYYHSQSLDPAENTEKYNIWFWDADRRTLNSVKVSRDYFYELMAMRCCEWALKSDAGFGPAIGLWLAAFFKAESAGIEKMPAYFGDSHADALVYATTAGVEYLHQALARAVKDRNAQVALGVIEALGTTAGEKSLLYRIGPAQPLLEALSFNDIKVRYSAAIAIGAAGPKEPFAESKLVVANLAEALGQNSQPVAGDSQWNQEMADSYALRAAEVMLSLAQTRNPVVNLSLAQNALVSAVNDQRKEIQILSGQILAHIDSPAAQRAIAGMALNSNNDADVRIAAFNSLTTSAKLNANMLVDPMVDAIYALISSDNTELELRSAAAAAYGALNLPSQKVKNLILDQAKS